jgi:hypothetical protein
MPRARCVQVACQAALNVVCDVCSSHCDINNVIQDACTDVHLC